MTATETSTVTKTMEKLKNSLKDGNYYESHQMYRTVYNRFYKQKKYDDAKLLLADGVEQLITYGQLESAHDLGMLLLECYAKTGTPVSDDSAVLLLKVFGKYPDGKQKREFGDEMLKWSSKYGKYVTGDPVLQFHVARAALDGKHYDVAEKHALLSQEQNCVKFLVKMYREWSSSMVKSQNEDDLAQQSSVLLFQSVCKCLLSQRVKFAHALITAFMQEYQLQSEHTEQIPSDTFSSLSIVQDHLVNLAQYTVIAVQSPNSKPLISKLLEKYGGLLTTIYPEGLELLHAINQMYSPQQYNQGRGGLNFNNLLSSLLQGPTHQ